LGSAGKSGTRTHARRGADARVLRIIGGTWRGRKLRFAAGADIRPTPDRVRETLFNWLGTRVAGARCLDLFAGSGALGLEALSRGAAHVTFVEQEARAARELALRLIEWEAQGGRVARADALRFLAGTAEAYDLVFLDPPFDSGLLARSAAALAAHAWLSPGALIYVEAGARGELPSLPAQWRLLKAKQAGEVGYYLFAHAGADA
jgi:16S rRNA (guanine966-N2)-methyltransferase